MGNYVASTDIKAFPVVNRNVQASGDLYARHTSEEMLTSLSDKLIDQEGFVITTTPVLTAAFEFCLHGYYFKINTLQNIIDAVGTLAVNNTIYAVINLQNNGHWLELSGGDEQQSSTYVYTSVNFTTTEPASQANQYVLALVTKTGENTYIIAEDSKLKFTQSSFKIVNLDCGNLDA